MPFPGDFVCLFACLFVCFFVCFFREKVRDFPEEITLSRERFLCDRSSSPCRQHVLSSPRVDPPLLILVRVRELIGIGLRGVSVGVFRELQHLPRHLYLLPLVRRQLHPCFFFCCTSLFCVRVFYQYLLVYLRTWYRVPATWHSFWLNLNA